MKIIIALTLLLCALLPAKEAQARDWYYSDCQSGAYASCVAGTNGTGAGVCTVGAPCQTSSNMKTNCAAAAAGDRFLLAVGGVWTVNQDLNCSGGTWGNPIVFDRYTPSWCTSTCPTTYAKGPQLKAFNTDFPTLWFTGGCGYTVQNLQLIGAGNIDAPGILVAAAAGCTRIINNDIQGFNIGIQIGQASNLIWIKQNLIKNNFYQGALVAGNSMVIEGNTFDGNGYGLINGRGHNLYQEADLTGPAKNNVTRGNTFLNNSKASDGATPGVTCTSTDYVIHGQHIGGTIENNILKESTAAIGDGCWGIAFDDSAIPTAEFFRGFQIRNNILINFTVGIGCNSCIAPIIENNLLLYEGSAQMYGIVVPDKPLVATTLQTTGMILRNNSMYTTACNSDCIGVMLGFVAQSAGTNIVIANNLMYFGSGANSAHMCFNTGDRVLANFTAFANNLCYHAGGNGRWSVTYANLAAAQAAGFDTGGLATDPTLATTPSTANNAQFNVSSGSPAINAGNTTYKARTAYKGCAVTTARDIGAYEFGCTP